MTVQPITYTKGGWLRKGRRITPHVIETYWPTKRVDILRRWWPTFRPSYEIVDQLNRVATHKPVNRWMCWLMASHLELRRPERIGVVTRKMYALGPRNSGPMLKAETARSPRVKQPRRRAEPESLPIRPKRKRKNAAIEMPITPFSAGMTTKTTTERAIRKLTRTARKIRNSWIKIGYAKGENAKALAKRHKLSERHVRQICRGIRTNND